MRVVGQFWGPEKTEKTEKTEETDFTNEVTEATGTNGGTARPRHTARSAAAIPARLGTHLFVRLHSLRFFVCEIRSLHAPRSELPASRKTHELSAAGIRHHGDRQLRRPARHGASVLEHERAAPAMERPADSLDGDVAGRALGARPAVSISPSLVASRSPWNCLSRDNLPSMASSAFAYDTRGFNVTSNVPAARVVMSAFFE